MFVLLKLDAGAAYWFLKNTNDPNDTNFYFIR